MPKDADDKGEEGARPLPTRLKPHSESLPWQWLRLPQPVKRVFDDFPLHTYPPNKLPLRKTPPRDQIVLYMFATEEGASSGRPSFNPGCLKWQTYLKFQHIKFTCFPSSNHASPTGALPFVIPFATASETPPPIPSSRIQRWTREMQSAKEMKSNGDTNSDSAKAVRQRDTVRNEIEARHQDTSSEIRYDAYLSLLDHRVRSAYLYALYLSPPNFESVALPLYIRPTTTNYLVRLALSRQLQSAAETELLKQASIIDVEALYRESEKAFSALSTLLGEDGYFFGNEKPSLFDASVFAYTNILLDEELAWQDRRLSEALKPYGNLVNHKDRLLQSYYPAKQ